ncbi:MAG TPA: nicotinate phosphoribosyltransferase, partial [Salinimicrobium sp.]|nr:nicotinate phosphoribosyltransferase [Salinimicrobium sp.]
QDAPVDVFGVGTSLVTGNPDAALDGVYKLAMFGGHPRIKLSETIAKITLPHKKQVYRMLDESGNFTGSDVVSLSEEEMPGMMYHPFDPLKSLSVEQFGKEPLLHQVMTQGKRTTQKRNLPEIADYGQERLGKLPVEYKRFFFPHIYKVGLSKNLKEERDRIREKHKKR